MEKQMREVKKVKMRSKNLFIFILIIFSICGCNVFAKENVPYVINGQFTKENNISEYDLAGVDIFFFNKDKKTVKSFTVVFFLFDEDGEPINTTKNNLVYNVEQYVEFNDSVEFCLSLDEFLYFVPEESCFIDYLYVSNIVYEDGTVWSDPFGLCVF